MPPRKVKPAPLRSILVDLPEAVLLRLVGRAEAEDVSTHDLAARILTEAAG